jgi:hypothetical protein
MVPSWPAVRREVVMAMPLRAARVVPWGRSIVAIVANVADGSDQDGKVKYKVREVTRRAGVENDRSKKERIEWQECLYREEEGERECDVETWLSDEKGEPLEVLSYG